MNLTYTFVWLDPRPSVVIQKQCTSITLVHFSPTSSLSLRRGDLDLPGDSLSHDGRHSGEMSPIKNRPTGGLTARPAWLWGRNNRMKNAATRGTQSAAQNHDKISPYARHFQLARIAILAWNCTNPMRPVVVRAQHGLLTACLALLQSPPIRPSNSEALSFSNLHFFSIIITIILATHASTA